MSTPTRLLLLGNGRWGSNIFKAGNALPNITVVPVIDPRMNWQSALHVAKYDAVAIATPPDVHAQQVLMAVDLKKPVFVEKPFTDDLWTTFHLARYTTSREAKVFVDHTYLFHEGWNRLMLDVAARNSKVKRVATFGGNAGPYRRGATMLSTLWDWAPHDLSMVLDVTKERFVRVLKVDVDGHGGGWVFKLDLQLGETRALLQFGNGFTERIRKVEVELEDDSQFSFDGTLPVSTPPLTRALQYFVTGARSGFCPQPPWGTGLAISIARAISECADRLREH